MRLQKWHGFFLLLLILGFLQGNSGAYVGINIGTEVSDLPSASDIVTILKVNQITHVKLYDADARMLKALSNSGIDVIVGVTNEEVLGIGESPSIAGAWINKNVAAYLPSTNITYIAVGSSGSCIFTGSSNTSSSGLTPPSALAPSSPQSGSFSGVSVSRLQLQLWVICLALVLP
ncbi:hypothetical protein SAY86_008134 [Trapa natans]|uniref:glucan endo-1,3-beta-D-glucosidase n=1 Tax=Trapa natans TaxID=22666 RepID=A0AAN7KE72_TRANT|nr:hypothetical protein SAY86_008134 [Trapa natans]